MGNKKSRPVGAPPPRPPTLEEQAAAAMRAEEFDALRRLLARPEFDLFALPTLDGSLLGIACATGREQAVRIILEAADRRGAEVAVRVLNQAWRGLAPGMPLLAHRPIAAAAMQPACLRILLGRGELEPWPSSDGAGYNVFNMLCASRVRSTRVPSMEGLLAAAREHGEVSHVAAVRALSFADSFGMSPLNLLTIDPDVATLEFLMRHGASPRCRALRAASEKVGDWNLQRFPTVATALASKKDDSAVRFLLRHTPLDERVSPQDPTLLMLSGDRASMLLELKPEDVSEECREFKDPFRLRNGSSRTRAGEEKGGAIEAGHAVVEEKLQPLPGREPPLLDVFATCSMFTVLARVAEGGKRADDDLERPQLRFLPPLLLTTFEMSIACLDEDDRIAALMQIAREYDSGFTVLHCSFSTMGRSALPTLEFVKATFGQPGVRRLVRMKSHKCGLTPLHTACAVGNVPLALALLRTGECDVNAQTATGVTALHMLLTANGSFGGRRRKGETVAVGELCKVLRALFAAGARDDLLTVDGDCAARLLAELLCRGEWDNKEGSVRRLCDEFSQGAECDVAEVVLGGAPPAAAIAAAASTASSLAQSLAPQQTLLPWPLVDLVCGFVGRPRCHYQHFVDAVWGQALPWSQDPKLPVVPVPWRAMGEPISSFKTSALGIWSSVL